MTTWFSSIGNCFSDLVLLPQPPKHSVSNVKMCSHLMLTFYLFGASQFLCLDSQHSKMDALFYMFPVIYYCYVV